MAERDNKGRFVKGHKGTGGRPKRSKEERYIKWMAARVQKEDWEAIVDAAIKRAKNGDNVARQWLGDYLMGKPIQQVSLQTVEDLTIELKWADVEIEGDASAAS